MALLHAVLLSPGSTLSSWWGARAPLVPPSPSWHRQWLSLAQCGVWLTLATAAADVLEAEVMLTSICCKSGGDSHKASPQIHSHALRL